MVWQLKQTQDILGALSSKRNGQVVVGFAAETNDVQSYAMDKLQRKRLNKAVQLLCDTSLPVNDIIAAVGYENNSYFHRVFRERYQLTPKEFRKKNSAGGQVRL